MEHLDQIFRIVEIVIAVVLVPSLKLLVETLIELNKTVALLAQQFAQMTKSFEQHVADDHENFRDVKRLIEDAVAR